MGTGPSSAERSRSCSSTLSRSSPRGSPRSGCSAPGSRAGLDNTPVPGRPSPMARWSPWRRRRATQYREERVAVPPRPRPFWPWLLLLLLLVLGALAAAWYFAARDEMVDAEKVPRVVGLDQAEAEERLERDGFESEVK